VPNTELGEALAELNRAVEKVVRLNGSVPDGFYIGDWAVIGAASMLDDPDRIIMFATPGSAMAPYQLHGLLDLTDRWIVADPGSTGPFLDEDDEDEL